MVMRNTIVANIIFANWLYIIIYLRVERIKD